MQQYPVKYIYNMRVDNWNRDLKKEEGKGHQKMKEEHSLKWSQSYTILKRKGALNFKVNEKKINLFEEFLWQKSFW